MTSNVLKQTLHPFTVHLASGQTIHSEYESDQKLTADEVASALADFVTSLPKPGWVQLENIIFFTGAVSAIEVEV